jgi:hypothetical protein
MNKKILIIFFVLLLSLVTVSAYYKCQEGADYGKDPYIGATTSYYDTVGPLDVQERDDVCYSSTQIEEFFCASDGRADSTSYTCSGSCIIVPNGPDYCGTSSCNVDSDGNDPLNYGFVTDNYGNYFYDSYNSNGVITEYFCVGNEIESETYQCGSVGFEQQGDMARCKDPSLACQEKSCTDSDGLNSKVAGYVTKTKCINGQPDEIKSYDECNTNTEVREYKCDSGLVAYDVIPCDGACTNGKCISGGLTGYWEWTGTECTLKEGPALPFGVGNRYSSKEDCENNQGSPSISWALIGLLVIGVLIIFGKIPLKVAIPIGVVLLLFYLFAGVFSTLASVIGFFKFFG